MKKYTPPRVRLSVMRDYLPIAPDVIYTAMWRGRETAYPFIEKIDHAGNQAKHYFVNIQNFVDWSLARGEVAKLPNFVQLIEVKDEA